MWGKRLKETIRWNQQGSPFASWAGLLFVLLAIVSVFVALNDTHFLKAATSKPPNQTVVLTASSNHTYYWDQSGPFPIEECRERFTRWLKTVKKPQVTIAGDRSASFGDTVRLINEVRRQGIETYQLETETRERP